MKKYNPTSPGRRGMEIVDRSMLTKSAPQKALTFGFHRAKGRNSQGRITTRHKGGGVKRLYRNIDFLYDKKNVPARIEALEYDPNRSSFIARVVYRDGERRYILAPQGVTVGSSFEVSENAPIEVGFRTRLKNITVGTFVYNIELTEGRGAQLARSAGIGVQVLAQDGDYTNIKLPSGEVRRIPSKNWASIGMLSNPERRYQTTGKAGRNRLRGIRPSVRGTAMNPRDHPHGGGEGRTQRGMASPKTKWGKLARGVRTRKKKKKSSKFIVSRRRK